MQFLKCRFAKTNSIYQQFLHLRSELFEVQTEINDLRMIGDADKKLFHAERIIEESFDVMHSAETLIRVVLREYPELDAEKAKQEVVLKNKVRGHYA